MTADPMTPGLRRYYLPALACLLILTCILLLWSAYKATKEWERSMQLLTEQRASQALTLMIMAFGRDMRGAQSEILPQLESFDAHLAPYALANEIGRAFSRFPYPESFFSWTDDGIGVGKLYAFNRTDRPPPWYQGPVEKEPFPVTILKNPNELRPLIGVIRDRALMLAPVIAFETQIGDEIYQVVARLRYGGPSDTSLQRVVGFAVNIQWVRQNYFDEITSQLSQILAGQMNTSLSVVDENGAQVTMNRSGRAIESSFHPAIYEERFPLVFAEPSLVARTTPGLVPERYWIARAAAVPDQSMMPTFGSAGRMFVLISVATVATAIALILTVRALRTAALLATMKSEFVSAVTHELKTPLSSIGLACETIIKGRVHTPQATAEYAAMLLNAVSRLNRTVDNLLSVARFHDVQGFYTFEVVDSVTVLEQVLDRFQPQLKEYGFQVEVALPECLPSVRADRNAIIQVFDNILDNSVRYSNGTRYVTISARALEQYVAIRITDRGSGIPQHELPHIFEKFFRGGNTSSSGSGLGLAIAQRVIKDHGGEIHVESAQHVGTTVEVCLKKVAAGDSNNETANFGC